MRVHRFANGDQAGPPDHGHDDEVVRARMEAIRAGAAPSVAAVASCVAYYAATWSAPNRDKLAALALVTFVLTVLLSLAPLRRRLAGRLASPFFLGWSASLVAVVCAGAHLDGGPSSPLVGLLFLVLPYAALAYRVGEVIAVAVMVVAGYGAVVVADVGHVEPGTAFTVACFAIGGWLSAWLAGIRRRQHDELARLSVTDPLTGCLNRRGFEARFEVELALAARERRPLALILVDLDDFKAVNDGHGHQAGDRVLRRVGAVLLSCVRISDSVGRLGGDEFAVLLHSPGDAAGRVADRLAAACREFISVSVGVAVFPDDGHGQDALGRMADGRLYQAKARREENVTSCEVT